MVLLSLSPWKSLTGWSMVSCLVRFHGPFKKTLSSSSLDVMKSFIVISSLHGSIYYHLFIIRIHLLSSLHYKNPSIVIFSVHESVYCHLFNKWIHLMPSFHYTNPSTLIFITLQHEFLVLFIPHKTAASSLILIPEYFSSMFISLVYIEFVNLSANLRTCPASIYTGGKVSIAPSCYGDTHGIWRLVSRFSLASCLPFTSWVPVFAVVRLELICPDLNQWTPVVKD